MALAGAADLEVEREQAALATHNFNQDLSPGGEIAAS